MGRNLNFGIHTASLVAVAFTTVSTAFAGSFAGVINAAIRLEGDSVPGVGLITRIDNVTINNNGDWLIEADTDFANTEQDTVLLNAAGVVLREGFGGLSGPPGALINSFDSVTLNNSGDGGFNLFLEMLPSDQDTGVYFNADLIIQEGDFSTASGFSPDTPYVGFLEVQVNNNNQLMVIASMDDIALPSGVDRAIVVVNAMTGAEMVIAKEGDVLSGQVEAVADFGTGPHDSAFNDNGDVLFFADLAGNTATDGVIYINNTLIAQEGSPSPLAGRNYEILSSRGRDMNNSGVAVFKANLDGDAADDEVIIANGAVFMREGDTPPGIPGFALTSFGTGSGPVQISDAGDVLWYGDWDDPNTDIDTGLFLNDQILVQEGVTMIDGVIIDTIASGQDAFVMSDNGKWIIFEGTLADGRDGAFSIQIGNPADLNGDGFVNGSDLATLLAQFGGPGSADLNGDGVVNGSDLAQLLAAWTG